MSACAYYGTAQCGKHQGERQHYIRYYLRKRTRRRTPCTTRKTPVCGKYQGQDNNRRYIRVYRKRPYKQSEMKLRAATPAGRVLGAGWIFAGTLRGQPTAFKWVGRNRHSVQEATVHQSMRHYSAMRHHLLHARVIFNNVDVGRRFPRAKQRLVQLNTRLPKAPARNANMLIAMPLMEGTLDDRDMRRRVSKAHYFKQITQALQYLYAHGWLHRDLSLKNIFVRGHECYLGDFDHMQRVDAHPHPEQQLAADIAYVAKLW